MTDEPTEQEAPPGGDFRLFVTRLSFQGMISMGVLENPLTGKKDMNLPNARMLLDDLMMLREKTSGNLDKDEAEFIEQIVANFSAVFGKAT
jgi:hypothetical protein